VVGTAAAVGMAAVVDGTAAVFVAGITVADTTAVAATGMQATIDGTEDGDGGAVGGTRGGCFRCLSLTRTTEDITVQATVTDMDRVTVTDMDQVTVTDTESSARIFELVVFCRLPID
jgi:hypothetical protein